MTESVRMDPGNGSDAASPATGVRDRCARRQGRRSDATDRARSRVGARLRALARGRAGRLRVGRRPRGRAPAGGAPLDARARDEDLRRDGEADAARRDLGAAPAVEAARRRAQPARARSRDRHAGAGASRTGRPSQPAGGRRPRSTSIAAARSTSRRQDRARRSCATPRSRAGSAPGDSISWCSRPSSDRACYLGGVMTTLELAPDRRIEGELCLGLEQCGRCAAICPENAIPRRAPVGASQAAVRGLDCAACARSSQPFGFHKFTGAHGPHHARRRRQGDVDAHAQPHDR